MIPPAFIHDLLARADIAEIVGRSVQLKKAGANYKGLCPFHGEKSPSFIVSPSRQTYHCFGCGAHGNAIGFLMEHAGLGFVDAIKDLAQQMGVTVPDEDVSPAERARAEQARTQRLALTEVLAKAARHYRSQLREHPRAVDYLKRRGLTGEIAKQFALGYAPPGWNGLARVFATYDDPQLVEAGLVIEKDEEDAGHGERAEVPAAGPDVAAGNAGQRGARRRWDRFRDRIIFPIRDVRGEVIGFGGRVIDSGEPKYLNSPETPVFVKGRELYGLFEARQAIRARGHVLVTEGYMDVVALAQLGIGNAVATLGTACTAEHVAKLLRFSEHIVFSFDGDAAGRRAAARALEAVLEHATDTRSFRFLFLPTEHDPDSFVRAHGTAAFEAEIERAVPLSQQLAAQAGEGCDLASAEGRSRMLATARTWIGRMPPGLLREQLVDDLARAGGVPPETLRAHWALDARGGPADRPRRRSDEDLGPSESDPDFDPRDGEGGAPWSRDERRRSRGEGRGEGREGREGRGEGKGRGSWDRGRFRGGPGREGAGHGPRRAPLRTTTLLDRVAWLLLHASELWLQLPGAVQERLCAADPPHGRYFSLLERVLHDEGSLPARGLGDELQRLIDAEEPDVAPLLARLLNLHEPLDSASAEEELRLLMQRIELQAIDDELQLLMESGELSEDATRRGRELMAERARLKAPVARTS